MLLALSTEPAKAFPLSSVPVLLSVFMLLIALLDCGQMSGRLHVVVHNDVEIFSPCMRARTT